MTYTIAELPISQAAYDEIAGKIKAAGYGHVFSPSGLMDMHGIGLSRTEMLGPSIPLLLFCPMCGTQHVDAPEPEKGWDNPPHRSHLCHLCHHIWRPSDWFTAGVAAIWTKGKADESPEPSKVDFSAFGDADHEWDHETGRPGIGLFANALQVWACMRLKQVSVAEAARAFCCSPLRIIEAVEYHNFMYLSGPDDDLDKMLIGHDGE